MEECCALQVLGLMDPANLTMKVSTLTMQRQQRLVDRVNRDRFMLVSEAAPFFQACLHFPKSPTSTTLELVTSSIWGSSYFVQCHSGKVAILLCYML